MGKYSMYMNWKAQYWEGVNSIDLIVKATDV